MLLVDFIMAVAALQTPSTTTWISAGAFQFRILKISPRLLVWAY